MLETILTLLLPEVISWGKAVLEGDHEEAKLATVRAMRKAKREALKRAREGEGAPGV